MLKQLAGWMPIAQPSHQETDSSHTGHPSNDCQDQLSSSVSSQARMRIAVDLTPLRPGGENGGAKIMTIELLQHLSKSAPELDFILLTTKHNHNELAKLETANIWRQCTHSTARVDGSLQPNRASTFQHYVRDRWAPFIPARIRARVRQLFRSSPLAIPSSNFLRSLGVNLLFCPFTAPLYFDSTIPTVSVIYDLQYLYYPEFFSVEERATRDQHFRDASRLSQQLVCISDYVRHTVLEHSEIEPEQVTTIHINLGYRLSPSTDTPASDQLDQLELQANSFLLYPANGWPHKNHRMLLTAFAMYRRRHPDSTIKLVCTGTPGAQMDSIQHAAARMGLAQWVKFPGYLSDAAFGTVLQACRALIFPSLYEGFGMPVLEAMALGKPVLCSNVTSLPEVAGNAALFFDPRKPLEIATAIGQIETDEALTAHLVSKGHQRLTHFTGPEAMAQQYLQVFYNIIHSPRPPVLHGVYDDGWTSHHVVLTYDSDTIERTLEIEFSVPALNPYRAISVQLVHPGKGTASTYTIGRDQTITIHETLLPYNSAVEFWIDPLFQPKSHQIGDDERFLGCQCDRWQIIVPNGNLNRPTTVD